MTEAADRDASAAAVARSRREPRASETDVAALHLALDAARRAILPWFRRRDLVVERKGGLGFDPVTVADRDAERAMRDVLARFAPEDGVLGEEFGATEGASGRVWTLDPIDGTRAFMSGLAHWGVLIALSVEGRAILGGLDQPYLGERYVGGSDVAGANARLERAGALPVPLKTRRCRDLAAATLFATDPAMFDEGAERAAFARLSDAVQLTRYGADCYGYAMVAAGHADFVCEAGLQAYDVRALIPIIEGAGGVVTDWTGGSAHDGGRVLASGDPALHEAALARLGAG